MSTSRPGRGRLRSASSSEQQHSQTEQAKRIDNALRQREAELERRERFLQRRERDLEQGGVVIKRKNWPICRPFTYHSISDDIPVHNQAAVRAGYVNWMGGVACFVFVRPPPVHCATSPVPRPSRPSRTPSRSPCRRTGSPSRS